MPTACFEPLRRDPTPKVSTSPHPAFQRFGEARKFQPVVFVLSVVTTLWFIYHDAHCMPLLSEDDTSHRGWMDVIIFNLLTLLLLTSYSRAVLQHPGTIPEVEDGVNWMKDGTNAKNASRKINETKKQGNARVCKWCNKYKPDRTHHCRVCRICILKMDHHCHWIYNCVGFKNYKFFFLLILYAVAATHFMVWTMLENVGTAWTDEKMKFFTMFSTLFGVTLAGFFACLLTVFVSFHIYLCLKGMTTIEFCEEKTIEVCEEKRTSGNGYSLGVYRNICAILGDNPLLWFLPVHPPSGDGLSFMTKKQLEQEQKELADTRIKTKSYGSCCGGRTGETGGTSTESAQEDSPGGA